MSRLRKLCANFRTMLKISEIKIQPRTLFNPKHQEHNLEYFWNRYIIDWSSFLCIIDLSSFFTPSLLPGFENLNVLFKWLALTIFGIFLLLIVTCGMYQRWHGRRSCRGKGVCSSHPSLPIYLYSSELIRFTQIQWSSIYSSPIGLYIIVACWCGLVI